MASLCADCEIFFDCEWCISNGTRLPRGAEYHTKDIRCDRETKKLVIITECPYYVPDKKPQQGKSSHLTSPLTAYDMNGNKIATYKSIAAAVRTLNLSPYRLRCLATSKSKQGVVSGIRVVFEPPEKWEEIRRI